MTQIIYHTIGKINDQPEPWDYFPFNDRDFTSVAELMLVPGCPPGLFTKQFVELAPMPPSTTTTPTVRPPADAFPVPTPSRPTRRHDARRSPAPHAASGAQRRGRVPRGHRRDRTPTGTVAQPHTYPYLVDKFFYSGYGGPASHHATIPPADPGGVVDGPGADGWFKMFEFFEVPSQSLGAIGPVAQGTDFDWARQDIKPGLLNLNLIIDEEVFFSVLGSQSITPENGVRSWHQHRLVQPELAQLRAASRRQPTDIPQVVTSSLASGAARNFGPDLGLRRVAARRGDQRPDKHPGPAEPSTG